VRFGINIIHNCYQKCTRSRAKRPDRPALVHLLYVYVLMPFKSGRENGYCLSQGHLDKSVRTYSVSGSSIPEITCRAVLLRRLLSACRILSSKILSTTFIACSNNLIPRKNHTPFDPLSLCKLVRPHLTSNTLGCNLLSQFHYISPISTEFQYPLWFYHFCY